jgi:hypothetical protein
VQHAASRQRWRTLEQEPASKKPATRPNAAEQLDPSQKRAVARARVSSVRDKLVRTSNKNVDCQTPAPDAAKSREIGTKWKCNSADVAVRDRDHSACTRQAI